MSTEILGSLVACDRIGVFHAGRLEALLDAGEASETAVVAAMFGTARSARRRLRRAARPRTSQSAVALTLVAVVPFVATT